MLAVSIVSHAGSCIVRNDGPGARVHWGGKGRSCDSKANRDPDSREDPPRLTLWELRLHWLQVIS